MSTRIITGDALAELAKLPAESVHCCVTSPPYFGLRDYGTASWDGGDPGCEHTGVARRCDTAGRTDKQSTQKGSSSDRVSRTCLHCGARRIDQQIGLEATPDEYVAAMVGVFREVRRVLRSDGTLWLNIGDSYAAVNRGEYARPRSETLFGIQAGNPHSDIPTRREVIAGQKRSGIKPKDLIGVPWMLAFALRADGWVLRQEIIWHKLNPMPESVQDRCTKAHEQIFMFAKARWAGPDNGRFAHISDEDARWLALLIDTEGCIVVKRNRHDNRADTFAPQVSVGNTSEALMREVVRIVGHGNLLEREGLNCRMLYWQLANGLARDFLLRIYPFLIVKRRQACIGIHVDSLTYYRGGKKPARKNRTDAEHRVLESLWARNKECNSFGSPDLSDVPAPVYGRWADCERYHFDAAAIAEPAVYASEVRVGTPKNMALTAEGIHGVPSREYGHKLDGNRNKRSVWTIATAPYPGSHFAVFPPALVEPCILAGCPAGGTVLDPFLGAGTTALVADRLGRNAIGIELNPTYSAMARRRIADDAGLFFEAAE